MRLTKKQLEAVCVAYVNPDKVGQTDFKLSNQNLAQLVDKIGLMITLDGSFYDKLTVFDGEDLPLGKTVEEWYQDLILPSDYEDQGSDALAPAYPSYRKPTYSYSLGRKRFKTTVKYDEYERACNDMGQYGLLTATVLKRLNDSEVSFFYKMKKQALAVLSKMIKESAAPSKLFAVRTAYEEGEFVKNDSSATKVAVVMKDIEVGNTKDFDTLINEGVLVITHMLTTIAKPVDTTTGEAFIKQVLTNIEDASFMSEGNALSGAVIGAETGLVLLIKKGIMPSINVDTLAGAFHDDKLSLQADTIIVDDFGDEKEVYAILMDKRGLKVHNDYRATRETLNGDGDFLNLTRHTENTIHISRNTFVHAYKEA